MAAGARESSRVTQRRFAAANMGLTGIRDGLRDMPDGRIGIILRGVADGVAGTIVAIDEPRERGDRLVADLDVRIADQALDKVGHHIGNGELLDPAALAGEPMQGAFAD